MVDESELQERAVAKRVTLREVEDNISYSFYFTAGEAITREPIEERQPLSGKFNTLERLTFCVLILKNGFTVVGKSACASPANYQKDIGERIAKENAVKQIWELMGYALCTKLMEKSNAN